MEKGEFDLSASVHHKHVIGKEALQRARQLVGESKSIKPSEVTDEDIAEAFTNGGFSEWDAELAGKVRRALASVAGLEHV